MRRLPIRMRLTAAFALAMLAVLVAAAVFLYVRVRAELDESVTSTLRARADAVAAVADDPGAGLAEGEALLDPEEAFAELLSPSGSVLDAAGGTRRHRVLGASELRAATMGTVIFEAEVAGVEDTARILARPATAEPGSPVVVVGQSLDDRNETLAGLLGTFAIGGPAAVVLASLFGYLLAAAGLRPVEAMRRRATEISLERDEVLPLPAAGDEIRRLGETLNQMLGRLRASFEGERRFVADASHELRTPISVLKAEIEAALQNGSYGEDVGESLRAALEECDHLIQLAEDLLVLARAGEGTLPVQREELDVERLLLGVRERFAYRTEQQGRGISVDVEPGLTAHADPLRMKQAVGNLVDNALRHGEGQITLAARRAGDQVELTVGDQGGGFPPGLIDTAFDRFTRADMARTRGGAGLGLAIVQSIARAHGGEAIVVPGATGLVRMRLPRL